MLLLFIKKKNMEDLKDYALGWLWLVTLYTWLALESNYLVVKNDFEKTLLNKSEICINQQEKQKDFNWTINIWDLKSCVSNSRKLTKNELDNILNI